MLSNNFVLCTCSRFDKSDDTQSDKEDEGPNFKTSGKLAAETNTYKVSTIIILVMHVSHVQNILLGSGHHLQ